MSCAARRRSSAACPAGGALADWEGRMSGAFQPVPVGRRLARRRFSRPSLTQATHALFRPGAPDLTAMAPASIAAWTSRSSPSPQPRRSSGQDDRYERQGRSARRQACRTLMRCAVARPQPVAMTIGHPQSSIVDQTRPVGRKRAGLVGLTTCPQDFLLGGPISPRGAPQFSNL
jgi:hypothetical protein